MKVALVTSNDYLYAAAFLSSMRNAGWDVVFVDVNSSSTSHLLKKLKLAFLFGVVGTLKALFRSIINRFAIKHQGHVIELPRELVGEYVSNGDFDLVLLVNYAWLFPTNTGKLVLNCHPSLLPKYRGLMPIPHAVSDALGQSGVIETGISIHEIDSSFDAGTLVWQKKIDFPRHASLYAIYQDTYGLLAEALSDISKEKRIGTLLPKTKYYGTMNLGELIRCKIRLVLNDKFVRFVVNGGVIGLISWILQIGFFRVLVLAAPELPDKMAISVYMAFVFSLIINFHTLKRFVFAAKGRFHRFVVVTTTMILLVGIVSEFTFSQLSKISPELASLVSYPIASLLIAPLSFLIKSKIVFTGDHRSKEWTR